MDRLERSMMRTDNAAKPAMPNAGTRRLMFVLGLVCTALGIAGLILPLMPGTVFLLVAVWAFSRSSERLHHWLFHHPRFGRGIRDWHQYRIIPIRAKAFAVAMMAGSLVYVSVAYIDQWLIPLLLGVVIVPVAGWIVTRPGQVPLVSTQQATPNESRGTAP